MHMFCDVTYASRNSCSHREMKTLHVKLERKNISSLVVDHALIVVLIEKKVALILSVYQAENDL